MTGVVCLFTLVLALPHIAWCQYAPGDANADQVISDQDVTTILNQILGLGPSPGNPDCNQDGTVNVQDTICVMDIVLYGTLLPPDPSNVAPHLDPTTVTDLSTATEFLYSGSNPIQEGVAPGTIDSTRVAVLRGKVMDREGTVLPGVNITILNHPEYGQTLSRWDGMFDMAVNGGGPLIVNYERTGYLPAQRKVEVPWQDFALLPDVALIPLESQVTLIDLNAPAAIQVARGSVQTDGDGTRQATVLFPQGIATQVVLADNSTLPISTLNIRATEYTVGPNGPRAMPGELPPTSAYTYAVELTADEAITAGAKEVSFSQPVPFYVENFLGFPVGWRVPVGYYDRRRGAWVPSPDGRIIGILGITAGFADLDVDGDGIADDNTKLAPLGITDAERERLASLYTTGTTLWRARMTHFSAWDCNWPYGCEEDPSDAVEPTKCKNPNQPEGDPEGPEDDPCEQSGYSTIGCQSQSMGERIPVAGTPFSLHYQSDRVSGRKDARSLTIPLTGAHPPSALVTVQTKIEIAGQQYLYFFNNSPNQKYTFTWDGKDAYGRLLQGRYVAKIGIGYVYPAKYRTPRPSGDISFGLGGDTRSDAGARQFITIWQWYRRVLSVWDQKTVNMGLAGWSLDVHHSYDPVGKMLRLGDGKSRKSESISQVLQTFAGNGDPCVPPYPCGDGGLATDASLSNAMYGLALAPDGDLYFPDIYKIRRIHTDGLISTVAGGHGCGVQSGDGGPALQASLCEPWGIAVGPDGSLYFSDANRHTVRRVGADGVIRVVAGIDAQQCLAPTQSCGDGGPATSATFRWPRGIALAADGTLFIVDSSSFRVRRVGPDGIITTVAGTGVDGYNGDGILATAARLYSPEAVALGPDGSLYITERSGNRVRRVGPDGIITTVAGTGVQGYNGDGILATNARLYHPDAVTFAPDGSLYIGEGHGSRVRRVTPDGIITTVAGTGKVGYNGDDLPATQAQVHYVQGIAIDSNGAVYITDVYNNRIRRINSPLAGYSGDDILIPSEDGTLVYQFDGLGKHLRTLHGLRGAVLYQFRYNADGYLYEVEDGDGNKTNIERDANGSPTGIVGPYGQRTGLAVDSNGYLASITNPAAEAYQFENTSDGLLTRKTDPRTNAWLYTYDAIGRLTKAEDPAGGSRTLTRTKISNGYEVSTTTALGRTTTYSVEKLSNGGLHLVVIFPEGTQTETLFGKDATTKVKYSDGTEQTLIRGPDPRFGMLVPLSRNYFITSGGVTLSLSGARTVNLSNSSDIFSLTNQTDTLTLNGREWTSTYDGITRIFTRTSPAGRQVTKLIDTRGRIQQLQAGNLLPISISYDANGRLAAITQGSDVDARPTLFSHNPNGYVETVTDALGFQTHYEYDLAGRATKEIGPAGYEILFGYDASDNLISLTPPGRPPHILNYNQINLRQEYVPPVVGSPRNNTLYSYNLDRQLEWISRPDSKNIDFAYDNAGRLSRLNLPNGPVNYSYNSGTGRLGGISSPGGITLSYGYDGMLLAGTTWGGEVGGSVSRTYDESARLGTLQANAGAVLNFEYDADGFLTRAGDLSLSRDLQNGLLVSTTLGRITDSYSYNGFGEVTDYAAFFDGSPIFQSHHVYDRLGRMIQKIETIGGSADTYDFSYDQGGRLVEVRRNSTVIAAYTYDMNGNRLRRDGLLGTETAVYDNQDRLLQYRDSTYLYTPNGELLSRSAGGQTTTYEYDVLGDLTHVSLPDGNMIDYVIDGSGRRIGRELNGDLVQAFLYHGERKPVAELDGEGNIISRYVYATRANVPDYMVKGGATYRIIGDHLGSPRVVVHTETGQVAQSIAYDEFGSVLSDSNPGFQPFGFAGGLYDPATKLIRFGVRDYDPEVGRWVQKDPLLFLGGDANLYSYVRNDPVNFVDFTGHFRYSADFRKHYRKAIELLDNLANELTDRKLEGFRIYGKAGKNDVIENLTPGNGPCLDVGDLGGDFASFNKETLRITIDENLLKRIDAGEKQFVLLLKSSGEHELVHYFDYLLNNDQYPGEEGNDYDRFVYGCSPAILCHRN
jgi:RHS repeat-associated protein